MSDDASERWPMLASAALHALALAGMVVVRSNPSPGSSAPPGSPAGPELAAVVLPPAAPPPPQPGPATVLPAAPAPVAPVAPAPKPSPQPTQPQAPAPAVNRSYASSTPRGTPAAGETEAEGPHGRRPGHAERTLAAPGDGDARGLEAPVLAIEGLRWEAIDRLVRLGAAALWIDLGQRAGRLMFDSLGLHEVTSDRPPGGYAERRFDLSHLPDARAAAVSALAAPAQRLNVSPQALGGARYHLLITAELDEGFLAAQHAAAERAGRPLRGLIRTDGVIEFGDDGRPAYRITRAVAKGVSDTPN
jgi:hypothetical protein